MQRQRGMTLVEVLIGLAIAVLAVSVSTISIGALTHTHLRSAAVELAGGIKGSYDRAIMEGRTQRIGFDLDKGTWWFDYTQDPFAIAETRVEDEKDQAERLKPAEEDEDQDQEIRRALEGGQAAHFLRDDGAGESVTLHPDIKFSKVWTGHQEKPFESGAAFLHFFRGGWTEPALIELSDGDDFITLEVAPLTGKVNMRPGPFEEPDVDEDDGQDEGDE